LIEENRMLERDSAIYDKSNKTIRSQLRTLECLPSQWLILPIRTGGDISISGMLGLAHAARASSLGDSQRYDKTANANVLDLGNVEPGVHGHRQLEALSLLIECSVAETDLSLRVLSAVRRPFFVVAFYPTPARFVLLHRSESPHATVITTMLPYLRSLDAPPTRFLVA
jgi:hypothetical protein